MSEADIWAEAAADTMAFVGRVILALTVMCFWLVLLAGAFPPPPPPPTFGIAGIPALAASGCDTVEDLPHGLDFPTGFYAARCGFAGAGAAP